MEREREGGRGRERKRVTAAVNNTIVYFSSIKIQSSIFQIFHFELDLNNYKSNKKCIIHMYCAICTMYNVYVYALYLKV